MSKLNFSFGCAFLILLLNSCNVGGSDVNPDMVLAACDGIASGGIQSRTQYQASQVAFGQTCSSEVQSRTCTNGKWSNWSGTFAYNACIIGDPAACIDTGIVSSPPISSSTNTALLASSGGTTSSGATETRTAYQYSSVPYGQTCAQETETRTCSNGTWSSWTPGDYTYTSCAVLPPAPCGTVASGGTQTQKMYQYAQEAFGFNCVSETQTRTCTNGTWSNWSGTFTQPTCKDFHTAAPTVFSIGSETPDSKIYEIHWHPGLNSLFVAMQDEDPTTFSLSSEIRRCPNNASCLPVGSSRPTYPLIPQFVDYSATVFFQDRPVAATQFTGPVIPGTADIGSAGSVSTVYPVMYSIVSDSALPGATMGLAEVGLQSAAGHFIYWMTAGTVNTTYSLNPQQYIAESIDPVAGTNSVIQNLDGLQFMPDIPKQPLMVSGSVAYFDCYVVPTTPNTADQATLNVGGSDLSQRDICKVDFNQNELTRIYTLYYDSTRQYYDQYLGVLNGNMVFARYSFDSIGNPPIDLLTISASGVASSQPFPTGLTMNSSLFQDSAGTPWKIDLDSNGHPIFSKMQTTYKWQQISTSTSVISALTKYMMKGSWLFTYDNVNAALTAFDIQSGYAEAVYGENLGLLPSNYSFGACSGLCNMPGISSDGTNYYFAVHDSPAMYTPAAQRGRIGDDFVIKWTPSPEPSPSSSSSTTTTTSI